MINKQVSSLSEAVADIFDGATVMIGGFGEAGSPIELIHALIDHGAKDLTVVSNNTGSGHVGLAALIENKQVSKTICSFPRTANSMVFPELYHAGKIELELVPQGTLAERIRAAKAGIGAFYCPVGAGTIVEKGKEVRVIDGRNHVLEYPIKADFGLIRAYKADRLGNLIYRGTSRTFNATMAGAAKVTIAEVDEVVEVGELDPESIVTPALYVDRVAVRPKEGLTQIVQKISKEEQLRK